MAKQALALRGAFPTVTADITPTTLAWTGVLTPTPLSRDYRVRITYSRGEYPQVIIVDPPLLPDSDGLLPHFYREGSLCLHEAHEWDESMLIVDTIVPWAAEWLAHYELWRRTGQWYGDGDATEAITATAVPAPSDDNGPTNRAERRRHAQREARRVRRTGSSPARRIVPATPDSPSRRTSLNGSDR